uniref:Uncharacterized protein n=1 Tax=Plectus sambesii TaxID=2011161 RepID=A0A914WAN0_9BILA
MPTYKLYYFNGRGRMEPARILFQLAGVPYEDIRIEREDWPKHKEEMPWGQMPVMEVDGKKIAQSNAIYQYLAKQFGYNGKSDLEAAEIQELLGSIDDIFSHLRPAFYAKEEEEKKKLMASISAEHVAPYLDRLEKRLAANGTGYFVGKDLTIADITFMEVLTMLKEKVAPGLVEKHAKLNEFVDRIKAQPKIKEWIEKRPKTEF